MRYKCARCGGIKLTATCPIDINTDYIYEESISTEVYCEDCDDQTNTIDIPDEEYFRIKDMSENEYDAYCGKNREEYDKNNKEE
jgi:hypothetical protein